jgi:hypothetical protein
VTWICPTSLMGVLLGARRGAALSEKHRSETGGVTRGAGEKRPGLWDGGWELGDGRWEMGEEAPGARHEVT